VVLKWIFFAAVFFSRFTEKFSSFFAVLIFLLAGFSSLLPLIFLQTGSFDFGTNEDSEAPV